MTLNRALTIAAIILGLMLAALCVYGAPVLRLSWTTVQGADSYRVYAGTNSRGYHTNWAAQTNGADYDIPEAGRYYFAVRAERGFETTNFAASALSDEVSFELLDTPTVDAVPHVRLTTVFQASRDLLAWHSMTSAPTWIDATNDQEFYRSPELRIEKAMEPK